MCRSSTESESFVFFGEALPPGSSMHEANDCSTNDCGVDQPSPAHDACAWVAAVWPSTLDEL
jgi:hypothetical protein